MLWEMFSAGIRVGFFILGIMIVVGIGLVFIAGVLGALFGRDDKPEPTVIKLTDDQEREFAKMVSEAVQDDDLK